MEAATRTAGSRRRTVASASRRARRLGSALREIPRPLLLLLIAGALLSAAWDLSLPAFQGPDEDAHFAYIQYLAENGSLPSVTSGASPHSTEQQDALQELNLEPLRGVLPERPAWTSADLAHWHEVERAMPSGARANGPGPNPQAKNPPLYYAVMAIPYRLLLWLPLLKRLFLMRLFSAVFYLITIAIAWALAGELFGPSRLKQLLAAGAVTLEPQLQFMSVVINADIMLVALTSAVLLACVRMVKRGPTMRRVLTASALTVCAVLTHGRGLVSIPVLFTGLVMAGLVHRPALGDSLRRLGAAAATLTAGFLGYFLFGRSGGTSSLYGGQVTQLNTSAGSFDVRQFLSSIYQFYLPRLPTMRPRIGPEFGYRQVFIETFYGTFGWLEVRLPPSIYRALQLASGAGLVAFYTVATARWRTVRAHLPLVLTMLSLLVTNLFFLHYVSYRSLLDNGGTDPLIVGRYLLPTICLFGVAIAFTIGSLPRRTAAVLGAALIAVGVLLSLGSIGITAARFYA